MDPAGLGRWLSHRIRSLSVALRRARGDRSDIDPMRRGGAKSFVDDLVFGRGVVLSRAATSLRSIETQPWTRRFVCFIRQTHLLLAFDAVVSVFDFVGGCTPLPGRLCRRHHPPLVVLADGVGLFFFKFSLIPFERRLLRKL